MQKVVIHNRETSPLAAQLTMAYPDVDFRECTSYDALPNLLKTFRPDVVYSVRFAGTPGFPSSALFGPTGPKWIAIGGAGTDHLGQWDAEKTTVTNGAGVAADMMAEYVMGGFLHFTLDVPGLQNDKAARLWQTRMVRPLAHKTLLIIGLGHTGRAVASRAKAFGMKVLGTRATPKPMANVDEVHGPEALANLLPRADFVAISTPLIEETRGLIGEEEFAAMKPGVILADVSRGGVMDQTALIAALATRKVAGAAVDVFESEPLPKDSPIWSADNVLVSPHCSSVHADWEEASFQLFLKNLGCWRAGEPLLNIVNPARGY